jgi:cytochrome P450
LKEFGFGKSSMEELIQEEIKQLCGSFDEQLDHPMSLDMVFNSSVVNALWTIISGTRFELDDPELKQLARILDEMVQESGNATVLNMFPSVRHIAPGLSGWTKVLDVMNRLGSIIGRVVTKHQADFESDKESKMNDPRDFIDAFLNQIETSQPGSSFHGQSGFKNLKATLLDLLAGGVESTATTLTWSILFMIKYPDIQAKVHAEILNEVGKSRPVGIQDRSKMPYTEAVVQEVLRIICLAPLGLPHYATEDIKAGQYTIPKGTTIFSNLHRITSNPKVFTNPRTFNPDRFLDSQGNYVKHDHNIPFSIGKFFTSMTRLKLLGVTLLGRLVRRSAQSLLRVALLRVALLRVALLRVALLRVALLKVALLRVALLRVAQLRVARLRVALLRVALFKVALLILSPIRVDPLRVTSLLTLVFSVDNFFSLQVKGIVLEKLWPLLKSTCFLLP